MRDPKASLGQNGARGGLSRRIAQCVGAWAIPTPAGKQAHIPKAGRPAGCSPPFVAAGKAGHANNLPYMRPPSVGGDGVVPDVPTIPLAESLQNLILKTSFWTLFKTVASFHRSRVILRICLANVKSSLNFRMSNFCASFAFLPAARGGRGGQHQRERPSAAANHAANSGS